MALDYQTLGIGAASVITAIGGVAVGVFTGRQSRVKDENERREKFDQAQFSREQAEEVASAKRIEEIAKDASQARARAREMEIEFDKQYRLLRQDNQRGWDLARYHFGLLSFVVHLMNNLLSVVSMSEPNDPDPNRLLSVVKNAMVRMSGVKIPITLEEPIPDPNKPQGQTQ